MKLLGVVAAGSAATLAALAALLGGWFLFAAGGPSSADCGGAGPTELAPIFAAAAWHYSLGRDGPAVLAGLTKVESDFGRNMGPSSAGAIGWTQFMPETWRQFGVDANGDGRRDPMTASDAIFSAARYLRHLGAPQDWGRALFGYNHDRSYVQEVLRQARAAALPDGGAADPTACAEPATLAGSGARLIGGGRIVPIPGQAGQRIDERIVRDVLFLQHRFHFAVTAGYAPTGHAPGGEHPLGLAIDVVPGSGGSWDDIDALARWAEPSQGHPRPPWRWVGYDGDPGHGRGNHLHLSWAHGAAPTRRPPAPWVEVLVKP